VLRRGEAVQVDPIKPKLIPPGTKRLKLNNDGLLSTSAFKFSLRRFIEELRQLSEDIEQAGCHVREALARAAADNHREILRAASLDHWLRRPEPRA